MTFSFKRILPHILVIIGFVVVSLAYFNPVLKGKEISQSDIKHYIGMSKQQKDFKAQTGEETYWTNSAFGGMPTYQLGARYPHNYIKKLDSVLRFLPRPADYLFIYFIGFYILLLSLKVETKLAALGAIAFGFSTYLIIILGVGHNSKAHAIAYMPLVLSGIVLTFQRKYVLGVLITAVAMGLEIGANHFQMTYYLMLLVIILGIVYLIEAYKNKELPHFFKSVGLLIAAVILSIGLNATNILATQEYVKESTRGKSELTINVDGSQKEASSSGLSKAYITEYSYGFLESFNLFIPRLLGGGNGEDVGKNSEMYNFYRSIGAQPLEAIRESKNVPTYWGDQPIVEAPAYIGAVILFLFVFALFLVKGRLKKWLVAGSILALLLSFGKNLSFLTDIFIDFIPLYNKFRAVSSIQVIVELCIPVLAIVGLHQLFTSKIETEKQWNALKYSILITGGVALLFLVFKSSFNFIGMNDAYYKQAYGEYGQSFVDALVADRKAMFTSDTLRTLILVLLSAGTIFMFLKQKLSKDLVIVVFAGLIIFDLVGVDRRYVNNENFKSSIAVNKPFKANAADLEIMKDKTHYRVFDITSSAARASYFHNSLSGYHAAKLGRYNELFDFHISKNNIEVLNMLNTKYVISENEKKQPAAYTQFTQPNGNAWFVNRLEQVENANEEILALDSLKTKTTAITSLKEVSSASFKTDSTATIKLLEFQPNLLKYTSENDYEGFAVFSEIYYGEGWQAYIDGKEVAHTRVDYVLRGLKIPAGTHRIEFKFEPQVIKTGSSIALASSIVLFLLIIGGLFYEFKKK